MYVSLCCTVAKDINSGVMQLIVECTSVTMETMSCDSHVTYWGCNVFAHATDNGTYMCILHNIYMYSIYMYNEHTCTCVHVHCTIWQEMLAFGGFASFADFNWWNLSSVDAYTCTCTYM